MNHSPEPEARRLFQDQLVLGAILFPIAWVGATVLYGWSAMLRLGHWPTPSQDDPSLVFGPAFHTIAVVLFASGGALGALLFLSAVWVTPRVVTTAAIRPDTRFEARRLGCLFITYLLAGIYVREDPVGVLAWIGD